MSTVKTNNVQVGQSLTATQNFTISVPAVPDGTFKIARGNSGATTADILTIAADNSVSISGNQVVNTSGTQTLTNKTYNGLTLTSNVTGFQVTGGTTSKTLIVQNSITFSGTDGSTLNIGAGGTLGTGAYAAIANYATLASPTFTGIPAAPTATADTNTTQVATTAYVVGQGYLKSTTASSTYLAISGGSLTGGLREARVAMGASDININTGNYFTRTISGTTTFTVSNVPSSGTAASFILDLTNGGSATVNWWTGVKWASGTAPTLTAAGRDVLGFFTHDGGTTWTGLLLGKDVK